MKKQIKINDWWTACWINQLIYFVFVGSILIKEIVGYERDAPPPIQLIPSTSIDSINFIPAVWFVNKEKTSGANQPSLINQPTNLFL